MKLIFELKKGTTKDGKPYFYLYNENLNKRIFLNNLELKVLSYEFDFDLDDSE